MAADVIGFLDELTQYEKTNCDRQLVRFGSTGDPLMRFGLFVP
jgi:hypothetical protein